MKGLDNLFQAFQFQIRNVHVRIEINGIDNEAIVGTNTTTNTIY